MLDDFTYQDYRDLLRRLSATHRFARFCEDTPATERYVILRHDVDLDPAAALRMANIERELGVASTYFVMVSSRYYNLFSPEHSAAPARLAGMGHEVAMHYDCGAMAERAGDDYAEQLQIEVGVLHRLLGGPVHSIAMHNPSVSGKDPFANSRDYRNAYDPRYTREIAYFSDSCGAWRNAAHAALNAGPLPERFQLLIHPEFWGAYPGDRWDRLEGWTQRRQLRILADQGALRALWSQHSGLAEHEARINAAIPERPLP